MNIITPNESQQYKIERWLSVAKTKSVLVVDDQMIAIKNLEKRKVIEILHIDQVTGRMVKGIYNRTISEILN